MNVSARERELARGEGLFVLAAQYRAYSTCVLCVGEEYCRDVTKDAKVVLGVPASPAAPPRSPARTSRPPAQILHLVRSLGLKNFGNQDLKIFYLRKIFTFDVFHLR